MAFSPKQVRALKREVDHHKIRTRQLHGKELSFLEAWHVIAEANRIFGFDGWSRETIETRCILNRELRGNFQAVYAAKVRISVFADERLVVREGHGTGEGHGSTTGEAHDVALKAAETDATKRALATFGKPFGLSLYLTDRGRQLMGNERRQLPSLRYRPTFPANISPRPADAALEGPTPPDAAKTCATGLKGPRFGSVNRRNDHSDGIDKAVLAISETRRIRDREHVRAVTRQPCLICGRSPSDPHHLRFAQSRALGRKVSDEFVVPLCRGHHRELHRCGDEVAWWRNIGIDPSPAARALWLQTHPVPQQNAGDAASASTAP
jgi:Rad52/22 family double-strand break repair protein